MEKQKIKFKSIIEILGTPKEHVEKTMGLVVEKVKERQELKVFDAKTFEAKKLKDKPFWTTFTEIDMEAKDVDALIGFCFDFLPSSIEIIAPEKFGLENTDLNNFFNDILARLHQYDMLLKNMHAQNIVLKKEIEKNTGSKE